MTLPPTDPRGPAATRRQVPTWVAVAVTAGVMLAIGVSFVVGVVVGAFVTRDGSATSTGSTGGTQDGSASDGGLSDGGPADGGDPAAGGAGSGALDECLVGTWRTVEHVEDWTTDQGQAELSGLERVMEFSADGTQTVSYDDSAATIATQGQEVPAVFDGRVVYRTSTAGGTMSFDLQSAEGTVTVDPDGTAKVEPLEPGTGEVSYTCDATTLRQEAEGYLSVYERTG